METLEIDGYKVRFFDLKDCPAFQGMAIMAIAEGMQSKIVAAGEVINAPELDQGHGLYYLHLTRGGHFSRSIWRDDGCTTECAAFNIGQGWQVRELDGVKP